MHHCRTVSNIAVLLVLFGGLLQPLPLHAKPPDVVQPVQQPAAVTPDRDHVSNMLRSTPLWFVENMGQFTGTARFQMQAGNTTIWVMDDALWLTVLDQVNEKPNGLQDPAHISAPHSQRGINLKLTFVDAAPHPRQEPFGRLHTKISHFVGAGSALQHADVLVWGGVRYVDLYPNAETGRGYWIHTSAPCTLRINP